MPNSNNVIRPPILQLDSSSEDGEGANGASVEGNKHELVALITGVVTENLQTQGRQMLTAFINPAADASNEVDNMDTIPDVVKSLRKFSADLSEYNSLKKSVDRGDSQVPRNTFRHS